MVRLSIRLMRALTSGFATVAALGIALAIALPARAQGDQPPAPTPGAPVTDDRVNAVAERLYCPVCENIPLDVCGTQACADWRQEIRSMLAQGMTTDQITASFARKYGQRVLASPEQSGINWLVWILPIAGVLVGAVVVALAIRRMAPGAFSAESEADTLVEDSELDPELVARLERELREFSS